MIKFSDKSLAIRKQFFFSDNDDYYLLRKHMRKQADIVVEYLRQFSDRKLNILEVGPSSNLYPEENDNLSTDIIGYESKKLGHSYKTLDISGNADYICSIDEVSKHVINERFDVLILLGVIEHVGNIHLLSNEFCNITNDKAKIFLNTPFMFKVHGPIPDFWRISQYGYEHLFGNKFDIEFDVFPPDELGKNSFPLSFNTVLTKK